MNWNEFVESEKEYPEKIVAKAIEGFPKATKGLVEMKISELTDNSRLLSNMPNDFLYSVRLVSPYVKDYSHKLLTFGYDVELNPINFILEEGIYKELEAHFVYLATNQHSFEKYMICKDGEMFEEILKKVFSSQKFTETVSGLMKIARKNNENTIKK